MSTWAIGDIQGCFEPLSRLLVAIDYKPDRDRLILLGDLVNRGPDSLEVLRWARAQGEGLTSLLGNHDLHLLASAHGLRSPSPGDTLEAILAADDRDDLLSWLTERPFLHRESAHVFVHAGLHPSWQPGEAERRAQRLRVALREDTRCLLEAYQQQVPTYPQDVQGPEQQVAFDLAVFTRLRCLTVDGALSFDFSAGLDELPADRVPWWRARHALPATETVVFGHWAAIGVHREKQFRAIDSGCVWGRLLSAYCIENDRLVQVPGLAGV